tara:strand:+ start:1527 stop:1784 length:258 start_codon:yes stop_codon:yes gene_type:complete
MRKLNPLLSVLLFIYWVCEYVELIDGISLLTKIFAGSFWAYGSSIQQITDNGYIMSGHTNFYGNDGYDVFLIKTDFQGNSESYAN